MNRWLTTLLSGRIRPTATPPAPAGISPTPTSHRLEASWAQTAADIELAQRLRYDVFATEMGAQLRPPAGTPPGLDIDHLDPLCEHLLIKAHRGEEMQAVGTYRILTPGAARLAGALYTEGEFHAPALEPLKPQMVELGRSCIHPDWRTGGVIMMLWSSLMQFMVRNDLRYMVGCASMSLRDGGHEAASLWQQLRDSHLADVSQRVEPRLPLPVDQLECHRTVEPPPLIKGYLSIGAQVLGPPAWDPDFGTADFPMLLDIEAMSPAYRKRLLRQA